MAGTQQSLLWSSKGLQAAFHERTEFGLSQKRTPDLEITEHSRRTQLSHPASQLLSLSPVFLTACVSLSVCPRVRMFILHHIACVCLAVHIGTYCMY